MIEATSGTAFAASVLSDTLWNELPRRAPLAVLVIDDGEAPLPSLSQQIADAFEGTAGLLRPVFVEGGYFDLLFSGYLGPLQSSDLSRHAGALLLGKLSVVYSDDTSDPGLAVVTARCEARLFRADQAFETRFLEVQGQGVEYRPERAEEEAVGAMREALIREVKRLMEAP